MLSVVLNPNLEDYPAYLFFTSLLFSHEELLRIKFKRRNTLLPLMRLSACLGCFIRRGGCRVLPEESRSWIWSADRDPRGAPAQGWQYLEIWTSTPSACTFWWIQTDSKLRKLPKWPIKFTFNAAQHSCKMKANFKINQLKKKKMTTVEISYHGWNVSNFAFP